MKKSLSIVLVLAFASMLIFSGCGKDEVVEGTDDLRCDGMYKTTSKDDHGDYSYLRFYEDGKVHTMSKPDDFSDEEAYEKLNTTSNPNQLNQSVFGSNTFKVNGNVMIESTINGVNKKFKAPDVEFTYQTNMGLNTCYVNIKGDALKMEMTTWQGKKIKRTYKFIEVD